MASIGSISCFRVIGTLPEPKMKLAVWTVPGLNGYGAQMLGNQDQAFEVLAVFYSSWSGVLGFKDALCALQGQIVTIVDDLGDTTNNCLIVEIGQARMEAAQAAGGIQERCEVPVRGVVLA
jgi:hypothetical protein